MEEGAGGPAKPHIRRTTAGDGQNRRAGELGHPAPGRTIPMCDFVVRQRAHPYVVGAAAIGRAHGHLPRWNLQGNRSRCGRFRTVRRPLLAVHARLGCGVSSRVDAHGVKEDDGPGVLWRICCRTGVYRVYRIHRTWGRLRRQNCRRVAIDGCGWSPIRRGVEPRTRARERERANEIR